MRHQPLSLTRAKTVAEVPWTLRVSRRVRRCRIEVSPREGVVVVVPPGVSRGAAARFVASRQAWIGRALGRVHAAAAALAARRRREEMGSAIDVPALGERWLLDPGSEAAVRAALLRRLRARAALELPRRLAELSARMGLAFRRVRIRCMRSRWGSCSAGGDITLNAKLLLLPAPAVEYVLLHELCHRVEGGHGRGFWRLLERWLPDAVQRRRQLLAAGRALPLWLEPAPRSAPD